MKITAVCSFCMFFDKEPNLEINFKEGKIYYLCPECRKENKLNLQQIATPFPKIRRM